MLNNFKKKNLVHKDSSLVTLAVWKHILYFILLYLESQYFSLKYIALHTTEVQWPLALKIDNEKMQKESWKSYKLQTFTQPGALVIDSGIIALLQSFEGPAGLI